MSKLGQAQTEMKNQNIISIMIRKYSLYFCIFTVIVLQLPAYATSKDSNAVNKTDNQSFFILRPSYTGLQTKVPVNYLPLLNKLLEAMRQVEILQISVIGHSDATPILQRSRNKIANNYQLSLARAKAIASYMQQIPGLDKNKLEVKGMGADMPLSNYVSAEALSLNRRIEVIVRTKGKKVAAIPGLINKRTANSTKLFSTKRINKRNKISLSLRNTDIVEVMDMLSRRQRVNILMSKDVKAEISVNLYDVSLDQAIRAISSSAGYAVERRHGSYFILSHAEAGKYSAGGLTRLKTFKVQYSKPDEVQAILKNHLSNYGKITLLKERNLIVVEDTPEFLKRIENLLKEIDKQPKQILIEAKILEVTLDDSETFGLDWKKLFSGGGGTGNVGTRGFASGGTGFFLDFVSPKVELALSALNTEGRVRTLSTPKLLALENQEASVVIGDRIGYRLTTTINQVTSESIEFLESGVILKVKPSVDSQNRIMLDIHPEVSTGTVTAGIPSQKTTEVTTQLLVNDGQTIFIGGLLKRTISEGRDSVPILGDIPLLGRLFTSDKQISTNTETVVMITPYIIENRDAQWLEKNIARIQQNEKILDRNASQIDTKISARNSNEAEFTDKPLDNNDELDLSGNGLAWNIADENIW